MGGRLIVKRHAALRMLQRRIRLVDVKHVLATGEVIEQYPADTPLRSRLVLGWVRGAPLHVVAADDDDTTYVITVYEPEPERWDEHFRVRRARQG
ncbi:MAG: DUF4258 domain-containing protein [Dehalococcoidia bacterium]